MKRGFAAIAALFVVSAAATAAPEVHVTGGVIRGQDLPDGSSVFRGIPYAAPPVGDLRWTPPQAVTAWKGVRNAVNAPKPCMQQNKGWNAAAAAFASEDCLYLSLRAPRHNRGDKLPVFFWIHGGSNREGSGFGTTDSPMYKRGVIMVGIEYRLGVFGFLASPELTAESPHHASGNYALLDQIAALKWVHDNIAAFGGDPANVTIGGQSAGAVDVGQLLRSPLARGLFAKAVQESGAPGLPRSASENEKLGSDLMALLHLPSGPAGLAALRSVPAETVLATAAQLKPPRADADSLWIATSADGWVLPKGANNVWSNGGQARVPLLIGDNTREFVLDLPDGGLGVIRSVFGPNAARALPLYGFKGEVPPPADPVLGSTATQAVTDLAFRCSTNQEAQWQRDEGAPVWRYQFGIAQPGATGVEHTAELGYVFGTAPPNADFAAWPPLQVYWTNFMKSGNPNGTGLPEWPEFGHAANYLAFTPKGAVAGTDLRGPICRLMADSVRPQFAD